MSRPWVAFDTETTGLEPGCRLIELAAVQFDQSGTVLSTFEATCNPGMPLPAEIHAITGLTDADLSDQPTAKEVLQRFRAWLPGEALLFAHNVRFDCDVLGYEWDRAHREIPTLRLVDTVKFGTALRGVGRCRLQDLVAHYGFTLRGRAHRALPDADATRQLVLQAQRDLPERVFRNLTRSLSIAAANGPTPGLEATYDQVRQHLARGGRVRFTYRDGSGNQDHPHRRLVWVRAHPAGPALPWLLPPAPGAPQLRA